MVLAAFREHGADALEAELRQDRVASVVRHRCVLAAVWGCVLIWFYFSVMLGGTSFPYCVHVAFLSNYLGALLLRGRIFLDAYVRSWFYC